MTSTTTLIGPFTQLLTMASLPKRGPVKDEQLEVIRHSGILVKDGCIEDIGNYDKLQNLTENHIKIEGDHVALPGLVDCHTHICFGGNRSRDYALRNSGSSYLEIAAKGGGIWDTVRHTRESDINGLKDGIIQRAEKLIKDGITTIEVKSGYGLSFEDEVKMLKSIREANDVLPCDLVPTCLAAHIIPKEFKENPEAYVQLIAYKLLPFIKEQGLANRVDAFVEKEAYTAELIKPYLDQARKLSFDITIHADQFTPGGSKLAVEYKAISADHLEASTDKEIKLLSEHNTIPVALPGASLGLGCAFTPARKLLDAGCSLAIASDYNPGSAPMGHLMTQAAILGTFEKLSNAEVLAGITCRAADALNLKDIGSLCIGNKANLAIYPTDNYQNITYHQGQLNPDMTIIKGKIVHHA